MKTSEKLTSKKRENAIVYAAALLKVGIWMTFWKLKYNQTKGIRYFFSKQLAPNPASFR